MRSVHSIPLHGLELIGYSAMPCNECCHGNTFFFYLNLRVLFMGSLFSMPLHRMELINFSATPGNNCCHGNTFFILLGLKNSFWASLHSKPLHGLEVISFSTIPGNKCLPWQILLTFGYVSDVISATTWCHSNH